MLPGVSVLYMGYRYGWGTAGVGLMMAGVGVAAMTFWHVTVNIALVLGLAPVSLEDLLALVRDPRWSNDWAGYGQVAHLRPDVHPELQTLWLAVTGAVTTPYVPIPVGAEDVPPEFKQHRYMTKDADSHFLDPDYAPLEATRYATRTFKRLMYHTCENPQVFYQPVTAELEDFERGLLDERARVERRAAALFRAGQDGRARAFLTDHVGEDLLDSLELGERLVAEVEEETRDRFGIRMPAGEDVEGETTPPTSQHMARGGQVHCYDPELGDFPREHGSYSDEPRGRGGPPADRRGRGPSQVGMSAVDLAGIPGSAAVFLLGSALAGLAGAIGGGVDRLSIGIGMIPRGEVGLIFASIGMSLAIGGTPVVSQATYSAVVIMVIVTTMATPPALAWSLGRGRRGA